MTAATVDLKAFTDGDLFRRLSAAIRAIHAFSEADRRNADPLGMACAGITTSDYLNPRTCRTRERRPEDVRRTLHHLHAKPRKLRNAHHKGGNHHGQYKRA